MEYLRCPKCHSTMAELAKEVNGHKVFRCLSCGYFFWASEASEEISLDLSNEEFATLARIAHERDITFNQLVNNILRDEMAKQHTYATSLRQDFGLPAAPLNAISSKDLQDYIKWLENKMYESSEK